MPEHFHLLISESRLATPSLIMQVLKQRVSRRLRRPLRRLKLQLELVELFHARRPRRLKRHRLTLHLVVY